MIEPPLEVCNSDGNPFEFCETRFLIQRNRDDVIAILNQTAGLFEQHESSDWAWLATGDPASRAARRAMMNPDREEYPETAGSGDRATLLGNLRFHFKELILSTNSFRRAEKGQMYLQSHLGDLVGKPLISPEKMQRRHKSTAIGRLR